LDGYIVEVVDDLALIEKFKKEELTLFKLSHVDPAIRTYYFCAQEYISPTVFYFSLLFLVSLSFFVLG